MSWKVARFAGFMGSIAVGGMLGYSVAIAPAVTAHEYARMRAMSMPAAAAGPPAPVPAPTPLPEAARVAQYYMALNAAGTPTARSKADVIQESSYYVPYGKRVDQSCIQREFRGFNDANKDRRYISGRLRGDVLDGVAVIVFRDGDERPTAAVTFLADMCARR